MINDTRTLGHNLGLITNRRMKNTSGLIGNQTHDHCVTTFSALTHSTMKI